MTFRQRLIDFVQHTLIADAAAPPVGESDSLIERGIIDSLGLLQLMMFIEQETGLRIPDDEVVPANFETVVQIEQLLERLQDKPR